MQCVIELFLEFFKIGSLLGNAIFLRNDFAIYRHCKPQHTPSLFSEHPSLPLLANLSLKA